MNDDKKVVALPGVKLQSKEGMTVDETLLNCIGRYTQVVVIGKLPDGSTEVNSPLKCETANWLIDRAKKIILE